jgi:hypothetical protein
MQIFIRDRFLIDVEWNMRLTHEQIQAIKQTAHAVLGDDSRGLAELMTTGISVNEK